MEKRLHILLADDDDDDRFFFAEALKHLAIPADLLTIDDGEKLIHHLLNRNKKNPDVLFIDINMPRINGFDCLNEIKSHKETNEIPTIMYSTSLNNEIADRLYDKGADFCFEKGKFSELVKHLQNILTHLKDKNFLRPAKKDFILN